MTGVLCLRLYVLAMKGTEYVSSAGHYFTVEIGSLRGEILDCNGVPLVDAAHENTAVLKPTLKALAAVENAVDTETMNSIKERMEKGSAVSVNLGLLEIEPNSDALMIKKKIRYSENQLAVHIIGYTDGDGRGVSGTEKAFDRLLYTGESLKVRLPADAYGRIISGGEAEIVNSGLKCGSVTLTVDSEIQRIAEDALDVSDIKEGGAVVADVETGAVRAIVSRPSYNPNNVSASLDDPSAPLVNRCLSACAVGSVFKAAVAAAALENGIADFSFTCTGVCKAGGVTFGCNNRKAHGELNLQKALECSCNTYFIKLAEKIGAEALLEAVKNLGFGQEIRLADGITADGGSLPDMDELGNPAELANLSFGQGRLSASMLQLVQLFSAIANGGKYTTPYIVEKTEAADGTESIHRAKYPFAAMSPETADRLRKMLTSVVENGNAKGARLKNGVSAAGKTATAQTGVFGENGAEICNTWFCGFFPADAPKYVIVIMKRGGSSGAEDCAPVFKKIADKISDLY